jgi:hypothetical protein
LSQLKTKGEKTMSEQITSQVAEQSAGYRALDAKIRAAAGWDAAKGAWAETSVNGVITHEPRPLKIRMNNSGEVLELGFEHAHNAVLHGRAELV